jgi:hypothetical protein
VWVSSRRRVNARLSNFVSPESISDSFPHGQTSLSNRCDLSLGLAQSVGVNGTSSIP